LPTIKTRCGAFSAPWAATVDGITPSDRIDAVVLHRWLGRDFGVILLVW